MKKDWVSTAKVPTWKIHLMGISPFYKAHHLFSTCICCLVVVRFLSLTLGQYVKWVNIFITWNKIKVQCRGVQFLWMGHFRAGWKWPLWHLMMDIIQFQTYLEGKKSWDSLMYLAHCTVTFTLSSCYAFI